MVRARDIWIKVRYSTIHACLGDVPHLYGWLVAFDALYWNNAWPVWGDASETVKKEEADLCGGGGFKAACMAVCFAGGDGEGTQNRAMYKPVDLIEALLMLWKGW